MTPTPQSVNPAMAQELVVPPGTLADGELVLLAIKPSGWFILLVSWPVAAIAVAAAAGAQLTLHALHFLPTKDTILAACALAVLLRLVAASFQWAGRVYVLTNRRVMWVYGVARIHVFHCPLRRITAVRPSATICERVLGLGSLFFVTADIAPPSDGWANIAHPAIVQKTVEDAIQRAV